MMNMNDIVREIEGIRDLLRDSLGYGSYSVRYEVEKIAAELEKINANLSEINRNLRELVDILKEK